MTLTSDGRELKSAHNIDAYINGSLKRTIKEFVTDKGWIAIAISLLSLIVAIYSNSKSSTSSIILKQEKLLLRYKANMDSLHCR